MQSPDTPSADRQRLLDDIRARRCGGAVGAKFCCEGQVQQQDTLTGVCVCGYSIVLVCGFFCVWCMTSVPQGQLKISFKKIS